MGIYRLLNTVLVAGSLFLGACQGGVQAGSLPQVASSELNLPSSDMQPAVRASGDAVSRTALASALANELGQAQVLLAQDAFLHSDKLTLERARHQRLGQGLLQGRSTEPPLVIRLLIKAGQCFLFRVDIEKTIPLPTVSCQPLKGVVEHD